MAKQLTEAGEEIALLVMLDTALPRRPLLTRKDKGLIKLQLLKEQGAGYLVEWGRNRIQWELSKLRRRFEEPETVAEHEFHNAAIEAAFYQAIAVYPMHVWDGPAVLFRPPLDRRFEVSDGNWISEGREYVFEDNQWTEYLPGLKVVEVPGDHDSMVLEPNVRVLGRAIRECVREAEAAALRARHERPHS